jgi:hypothetical protein
VARGGVDPSKFVHDCAHHSVAHHGQDGFTHRASETMHTLQKGFVNAGFIFFSLAILATLIFGRYVCGWGCHILALQDFCGWLLKKIGLTPKPFRSRIVGVCAAHWRAVHVCLAHGLSTLLAPHEPLIPKFTNHLVTTNFWQTFPSVAVAIPFLFVCGFMTVYFLGQKGFCTYACPYGGFFGLADKLSPGQIRVTLLQSMRPLHGDLHVKRAGARGSEAIRDGSRSGLHEMHGLRQRLPKRRALLRFRETTILVPKSDAIKRTYSLTCLKKSSAHSCFLEVSSLFAAFTRWSIPDGFRMCTVTTFLTLKNVEVVSRKRIVLLPFQPEVGRQIRKAGWAFATFACAWIGLNAPQRLGPLP